MVSDYNNTCFKKINVTDKEKTSINIQYFSYYNNIQ